VGGLGYPALFVDEKGKMRETWTDSLGRLIEVDEPDPAATTVRVYWWRGRRRGTSIATQSCAAAPDYTAESGLCREFWRQVQPGGSVRVQNNAILNAFLGNTVSGLVNVGRTIFGQGGAPSPAAVALTGLGLPSGGPGAMGVAGMAQGAEAKARWNCASLYFQGKIPLCARNDMVRSFFQSPLRNGCAR